MNNLPEFIMNNSYLVGGSAVIFFLIAFIIAGALMLSAVTRRQFIWVIPVFLISIVTLIFLMKTVTKINKMNKYKERATYTFSIKKEKGKYYLEDNRIYLNEGQLVKSMKFLVDKKTAEAAIKRDGCKKSGDNSWNCSCFTDDERTKDISCLEKKLSKDRTFEELLKY